MVSTQVRAIQIPRYGGPEVLKLVEGPPTPLGAAEVRITVHVAGVNFADLMMRMGNYPEAPNRPFVPGYEVSGVVSETGSAVTDLHPGDRVVAVCRFGGYTSELVLPREQVWPIPFPLSFEDAAAIPVNFITAWIALEEMARVRKGDRVLIHSAAGGVGVAAIQLAKRRGASVTGLTGSPERKSAFIREMGAVDAISVVDWESAADQRYGLFDVILDPTNGESAKRSFRRLALGGRLVIYGASSMIRGPKRSLGAALSTLANMPLYHPIKLMNENKGVFGLNVLKLMEPDKREMAAKAMERILALFEKRELRAAVAKTFPLSEAAAAHEFLQSRGASGKVVLRCQQ